MGPFVFFTDEISPTLEKVAESFAETNRNIIVITSEHAKAKASQQSRTKSSFETWFYYQSFSYWEHFKLLPTLLFKKPEVTHFFIHDVNNLKYFFPLIKWFHQWPDCITSVTFLNNNDWEKNSEIFQKVSRYADVVTFPDLSSMKSIRGFSTPKKQLRSLLPPFLTFKQTKKRKPTHYQIAASDSQKNIFFVYESDLFQPSSQVWADLKQTLSRAGEQFQTLIWMDASQYSLWDKKRLQQTLLQKRLQAHVIYLPLVDLENFLQASDIFLLFHKQWPALEASQIIDYCLNHKTLLVLQDKQATQYSSCLKHQENCYILHSANEFKSQVDKILKLKPDFQSTELSFSIDPYINELTRIYNKALKSKELYYV